MKNIVKKAAKYESKKSLDGPMKFLKGNASKAKKAEKSRVGMGRRVSNI